MSQSGKGILVTGGAGFIGSHIVKALVEKHPTARIVVLDDLSTGFADSLPSEVMLIKGNILDTSLVDQLIQNEKITTIIHLAAKTVIPESIARPQDYYQTNTMGTLNLLFACAKHGVKHFVYSSTAAVYGIRDNKITEQDETAPSNPYGRSKLMSEQMLKDIAKQYPMNFIILRYFNVAGAALDGTIGQRTPQATHLVKVAVQTACGLKPSLSIFGNDYPTPDGTCIRDFIHVSDLATAHCDALRYLENNGESITLNCGYGRGFSVMEVVKALEKITQQTLPTTIAPAREGDLACVIADNTKIKEVLNWKPQFDDIGLIVKSALEWEKKLLDKSSALT